MFNEKLQNLFSSNSPVKKVEYTTSGNGALKLTSTGDPFVDQFGLISQYRQLRPYSSISKDMQELWDIDPMYTLKLLFYIRLITRKVKFSNGTETSKVQKGAGLRHESFMRMLWLAVNHSDTFYKNLPIMESACDSRVVHLDLDLIVGRNFFTKLQVLGFSSPAKIKSDILSKSNTLLSQP